MEPDFSGYVTKNDLVCSDGRTIMPNAFKHQDGTRVPLVWQHQHGDAENVLGHVDLENRPDGVYGRAYFNDTPAGQHQKLAVQHGDITAMSIFANQLQHSGKNVIHGAIREVSLVLAGANPGATIDFVNLAHSEGAGMKEEAIIYTDDSLSLKHGDEDDEDENLEHDDQSLKDVLDSLNPEQMRTFQYLLGQAVATTPESLAQSATDADEDNTDGENADEDNQSSDDADDPTDDGTNADDDIQHTEGSNTMTHTNVFEQQGAGGTQVRERATLTHDQLKTIVDDGQKMGSLKDSFLAHAGEFGIQNIDLLFPDAKAITTAPELISRRMEWVQSVLGGARKSPFSRIKTLSADITHEEARARGYVKGNLKKEEFFGLAKRVTTPVTVYKKQKLDRDDIIDITELDVVVWLKGEMRLMLDEELARAILIGDGREVDSEDKIKEPTNGGDGAGIRSIANDNEFYAPKIVIPANVVGDSIVEAILRARPKYRGSGTPVLYCTESLLTDLLLIKDKMGRRLYDTQAALESAIRVRSIIPVDVLEDQKNGGGDLLGIIVNMADYTIGADRGGQVAMFDDFDIDYNQYKYLIETRISGTLTKYRSALVLVRGAGTLVEANVPTFNQATGVVTIPNKTGVVYRNKDTGNVLTAGAQTALAAGSSVEVEAVPADGYFFAHNTDNDWEFARPAA